MRFPGDNLQFSTRSAAEERLFDFFAVYNCAEAPDSYFEESLSLLRTIKVRHREVIDRLTLYLEHAKAELLRREISREIERRKALEKPQKSKKKDRKDKK